jgi:hypothetical protein
LSAPGKPGGATRAGTPISAAAQCWGMIDERRHCVAIAARHAGAEAVQLGAATARTLRRPPAGFIAAVIH